MCIPVYPGTSGWTLGLPSYFSYCEYYCYKHWSTNISSRHCFQLFWVYPEVKLLDHVVILFFNIWKVALLFCKAAVSFYIPNDIAQWFQFLHILVLCLCMYVCVCIQIYKYVFSEWSIFSSAYRYLFIFFLEKYLVKSFVHFWIRVFAFCWVVAVLCIFWVESPSQIYGFKIFSPILWVAIILFMISDTHFLKKIRYCKLFIFLLVVPLLFLCFILKKTLPNPMSWSLVLCLLLILLLF